MVQKLKSALKNPPLRLALKAALFGSALFGSAPAALRRSVRREQAALFFALFVLLYSPNPAPRFLRFFSGFALPPLRRCFSQERVACRRGNSVFVLIFVLLLGTKDLVFAKRRRFFAAVNLLFGGFFCFSAEKHRIFLNTFGFYGFFLLFKDALNFMAPYFPRRHF